MCSAGVPRLRTLRRGCWRAPSSPPSRLAGGTTKRLRTQRRQSGASHALVAWPMACRAACLLTSCEIRSMAACYHRFSSSRPRPDPQTAVTTPSPPARPHTERAADPCAAASRRRRWRLGFHYCCAPMTLPRACDRAAEPEDVVWPVLRRPSCCLRRRDLDHRADRRCAEMLFPKYMIYAPTRDSASPPSVSRELSSGSWVSRAAARTRPIRYTCK